MVLLIQYLSGLKTALVELEDFSSGTSSRSTKLLHGGVRYLQKAIFNLDIEQYKMVKEALHERANLLEIAPHLSYPLPIVNYKVFIEVLIDKLLMHCFILSRCYQFILGGKFLITGLE